MRRSRLGPAAALLIALSWPAAAYAQAPESEARHHFDEGSKAYALGEFPRAIAEYRAAFNVKPVPALLYNIAQAYRASGDLQQALFFYRSYLRAEPKASNRREVDKRIHDLDAQIQHQKTLATEPPTDTISATKPPSPAVEPPAPQLEPPARQLEPPAPPASAKPSLVPSVSDDATVAVAKPHAKPLYKKWWLWTAVGVVAAGAAVGLGLGLTANSNPPPSHFGDTHVF